jgi:hypothetical protein
MTDIKVELARLLHNEPPAPDQVGEVVTRGRRALRRRTVLTAVAGTAGTAAVTAAVVVPLSVGNNNGAGHGTISVRQHPTAATCQTFFELGKGHNRLSKGNIRIVVRQWRKSGHQGNFTTRQKKVSLGSKLRHGAEEIRICAGPQPGKFPGPRPRHAAAALSGPRYSYTEAPTDIASRLGSRLAHVVTGDNLNIVFSRPFAQESSTLEKGHPSYYDGNVDVSLAGGHQGDISVQVSHQVTTQVPFDSACDPPHCVETTLADGSVLRTGQVDPGAGLILTAEIHRPDGVVVQAQESNYGFGPNAPMHSYGDQPLTLEQLTAIAEDSAFTF